MNCPRRPRSVTTLANLPGHKSEQQLISDFGTADIQFTFHFPLIGPGGAGKSSLIGQLMRLPRQGPYIPTASMEDVISYVSHPCHGLCRVILTDISGQDILRTPYQPLEDYFGNAVHLERPVDAVIFVLDLMTVESYDALANIVFRYMQGRFAHSGAIVAGMDNPNNLVEVPLLCLGNKTDVEQDSKKRVYRKLDNRRSNANRLRMDFCEHWESTSDGNQASGNLAFSCSGRYGPANHVVESIFAPLISLIDKCVP